MIGRAGEFDGFRRTLLRSGRRPSRYTCAAVKGAAKVSARPAEIGDPATAGAPFPRSTASLRSRKRWCPATPRRSVRSSETALHRTPTDARSGVGATPRPPTIRSGEPHEARIAAVAAALSEAAPNPPALAQKPSTAADFDTCLQQRRLLCRSWTRGLRSLRLRQQFPLRSRWGVRRGRTSAELGEPESASDGLRLTVEREGQP